MLINVKKLTIVRILASISMIKFFFQRISFYEQLKFHAQLR